MTGWMNSKWSRSSKKLPQLPTSKQHPGCPSLELPNMLGSRVVSLTPTAAQPSACGLSLLNRLINRDLPTPEFPTTARFIQPSTLSCHEKWSFHIREVKFFAADLSKSSWQGKSHSKMCSQHEHSCPKCREKNIEIYPTIISVSLSSKYMVKRVKHYNNSPNWLKIMFGGFPPSSTSILLQRNLKLSSLKLAEMTSHASDESWVLPAFIRKTGRGWGWWWFLDFLSSHSSYHHTSALGETPQKQKSSWNFRLHI